MNNIAPRSSALRRGRRSIASQPYLITVSTHERVRWFCDPTDADRAASVLNDNRTWPDANVLAWVLMPDHLHLMLTLESRDPCAGNCESQSAGMAPTTTGIG
ncbi:MAG: transposase [Rhodanobacteraceae bacterium]|nr:transposase [Rhodanobacteraceae bacterium]